MKTYARLMAASLVALCGLLPACPGPVHGGSGTDIGGPVRLVLKIDKPGFVDEPVVTVIVKPQHSGLRGRVDAPVPEQESGLYGEHSTAARPVSGAGIRVVSADIPAFTGRAAVSAGDGTYELRLRDARPHNLKPVDFTLTVDMSRFQKLRAQLSGLSASENIPLIDLDYLVRASIDGLFSGDRETVDSVLKTVDYYNSALHSCTVFKEKLEQLAERLSAELVPVVSGCATWWNRSTAVSCRALRTELFESPALPSGLRFPGPSPSRLAASCLSSAWSLLEMEAMETEGSAPVDGRLWKLVFKGILASLHHPDRPGLVAAVLKRLLIEDFYRRLETALAERECVFVVTKADETALEKHVRERLQPDAPLSGEGFPGARIPAPAEAEDLVDWWREQIIPHCTPVLARSMREIDSILTIPASLLSFPGAAASGEGKKTALRPIGKEERNVLDVFLDRERIGFIELSFAFERIASALNGGGGPSVWPDLGAALERWMQQSVFHQHLAETLTAAGLLPELPMGKDILATQARIFSSAASIVKALGNGVPEDLFADLRTNLSTYETALSALGEKVGALPCPETGLPILNRLEINPLSSANRMALSARLVNFGLHSLDEVSLLVVGSKGTSWDYLMSAPPGKVEFLDTVDMSTTIPASSGGRGPGYLLLQPTPSNAPPGRSIFAAMPAGSLRPPEIERLGLIEDPRYGTVVRLDLSGRGIPAVAVSAWIDGIPLEPSSAAGEGDGFSFIVPPALKSGQHFVRAAAWNSGGQPAVAGVILDVSHSSLSWWFVIGIAVCLGALAPVVYRFGGFSMINRFFQRRTLKARLLELKEAYRNTLIILGRKLAACRELEGLPPRLKEIHSDLEKIECDREEISGEIDIVLKEEAVMGELSGTWEKVKTMVTHLKNLKDELAGLDEALNNACLLAGQAVVEEKCAERLDVVLARDLDRLENEMDQVKRSLWKHGDSGAARHTGGHGSAAASD